MARGFNATFTIFQYFPRPRDRRGRDKEEIAWSPYTYLEIDQSSFLVHTITHLRPKSSALSVYAIGSVAANSQAPFYAFSTPRRRSVQPSRTAGTAAGEGERSVSRKMERACFPANFGGARARALQPERRGAMQRAMRRPGPVTLSPPGARSWAEALPPPPAASPFAPSQAAAAAAAGASKPCRAR